VELQIPPSLNRNFKAPEENLRPVGLLEVLLVFLGHTSNFGANLNQLKKTGLDDGKDTYSIDYGIQMYKKR
jgi:hypothetical protein